MTASLLQISGLESGYGEVQVLWGVDLDVAAGEIVCVIGSNGAGKTTLLRTISGLVAVRAGKVTIAGQDFTGATPAQVLGAGVAHVGGEQQMCAIGRGIMSRPKLLMIDELSLGLAPKAVEQLSAALVRIQHARELAILLVEQDVLAALELSSRAFVIDRGRVALSGRADMVSKDPKVREAYLGEL